METEHLIQNRKEPVSREILYKEVWAEPMTTVAKKYGVSGSFLARVCTLLNLPRPPRGYWARVAAGYTVPRPSLPNPKPGAEIEWARYGQARRAPLKLENQILKKKRRKRSELPALHPLLEGFQERLNEGRESYFNPFTKPVKRLLLSDIITSKKTASRAIDVANELYLSLEAHGHQVMFSPRGQALWRQSVDEREKRRGDYHQDLWSPSRPTVVFIGTVAIGLTVYEMTEYVEVRNINGEYVRVTDLTPQQLKTAARSYSWTSTRDMQSGRLCIQAYSPYQGTEWRRQWQEAKAGDFPRKVPAIINELEAASASIAKQVEEAERKAEVERQQREQQREIERQRWEVEKAERAREEAEQRRIKAERDSREELSGIINAWAKAKRVEEFFADAERRAADLSDDEKVIVLERLKLAREMVGSTDALQWLRSWKAPDER